MSLPDDTARRSDSHWRLFDDASPSLDRFGLLLLITTIAVVTMSLVDLKTGLETFRAEVGQVLVTVFVGATLLLALRASGVARRYRLIADIVIGLGIAITLVLVLISEFGGTDFPVTSRDGITAAVWVVLSLFAPLVVVRRVVNHPSVSAQTLLGAVSAYLLIALAFSFAFLAIDTLQTQPFFGAEQPTTSFMYYSLVTVTTLGYGDLAAIAPLGRLLSTTEAVIGQVYLVTFVAMIVGIIVEQRQRRAERGL